MSIFLSIFFSVFDVLFCFVSFVSKDVDNIFPKHKENSAKTIRNKKRIPLTCTCDCDSSCSSSFRSQLYLWPGAEMMISMTSRQRSIASPGGARVGDITVELILSYSYSSNNNQIRNNH